MSDANVGNISLVAMQFTGDHFLGSAPPPGVITLTGETGLLVEGSPAAAEVTINNDLATTGDQTWTVAAGNSPTLPALVTVSSSGGGGLDVQEGVFLLDDVSLGTAFQASGGELAGDGVVYAITVNDGVVAPSDGEAGPIGLLVGANGVALDGGVYEVTIDGVAPVDEPEEPGTDPSEDDELPETGVADGLPAVLGGAALALLTAGALLAATRRRVRA